MQWDTKMECSKCHRVNPHDVKFCVNCGNLLETTCARCGSSNSPTFNFCGQCGFDLSKAAETAALNGNEHHTRISESLSPKTIASRIPTESERKHVTVLFSDLSGYTAIAEKLDPEEVKEITAHIFKPVSDIIAKYDGFVEKYAGDAVMALFGAGQSHEDDPVRALQAAREIHRVIESISPQYEDRIEQPLKMHTGINTGLVVTGELNLDKGVHGVAGDAINVAARLSSLANAGEILVDRETYSRTEGYFQFDNLQSELESKRILQEASVIGRSFYYEILQRVSEIRDNIDKSLSGLERFNLIRTKSIEPHLEYIFKHALTQEVVYNGLLKKERREIHERIARVIEELFTDRLPEFYETLAFHYKGGKTVHKAIKYLMKSGEKSLRRYALDESTQYYQEAFDLLTKKMDNTSNKDKKLLVFLLVEWALVLYYQGNFKRINNLFDAHEALAETIGDDENLGMFYAWLGFALYFRGRVQDAYGYLQKALKIGENIKCESVVGYANTWLTFVCANLGLFDEGIQYGERARKIAEAIKQDQYLYFKSRAALGFVYYIQGKAKEVYENGKIILEYGQRHSNIRGQVMGYWILGFSYTLDGNHAACIECFEKALQISSDPFYSQFVKMSLGGFYTQANQFSKAEALLSEVAIYIHTYGCELFDEWVIPDLTKIRESRESSS